MAGRLPSAPLFRKIDVLSYLVDWASIVFSCSEQTGFAIGRDIEIPYKLPGLSSSTTVYVSVGLCSVLPLLIFAFRYRLDAANSRDDHLNSLDLYSTDPSGTVGNSHKITLYLWIRQNYIRIG